MEESLGLGSKKYQHLTDGQKYKRNLGTDFKGEEEKLRMWMDVMNIRKTNVSSRKKQTSVANAVFMSNTIRILNVVLDLVSYKSLLILEGTVLVEWWEEKQHSSGLTCDWLLKTLKKSIKLFQNSSGNGKRDDRHSGFRKGFLSW